MSVKMASRQPVTLMTREYTLIILSKILLVLCILLKNETSLNFSSGLVQLERNFKLYTFKIYIITRVRD